MQLKSQSDPSPFNPANPGTDECRWVKALDSVRTLILPEAEIVVVSPHPDDETLGAGGLMRTASNAAHKVSHLSVTDGESAYPDWIGLHKIRRREVARAVSVLCSYPITQIRLGIPDGRVSEHREALFDALDRIVSPTTLLVAPYEKDGHPDHERPETYASILPATAL